MRPARIAARTAPRSPAEASGGAHLPARTADRPRPPGAAAGPARSLWPAFFAPSPARGIWPVLFCPSARSDPAGAFAAAATPANPRHPLPPLAGLGCGDDGAGGAKGLDGLKTATDTRQRSTAAAAIGLTVLSGLLYVLGYTLSKGLVADHGLSPLQVTFLRCVAILLAGLLAIAWPRSGMTLHRLLRPERAWPQRAAAAALVVSNVLAVLAYTLLPVTAASALGFTAPLLLALFGGLFLRERVSLGRWLGTGLGFAGMLLIVRPGGEASLAGIAAAVAGALTYATYQIFVRQLRAVATTRDTILQVALVGAVLLAVPVAADWRPVGLVAAGLVLLVTLVQTAALASIAAALHRGEASRLAPWQFSGLLWAMALDALVLQAPPTAWSLAGALLVIGGGVLAQLLAAPDRA